MIVGRAMKMESSLAIRIGDCEPVSCRIYAYEQSPEAVKKWLDEEYPSMALVNTHVHS
jgi:hypothetical protein